MSKPAWIDTRATARPGSAAAPATVFRNRAQAGRALASELLQPGLQGRVGVLALPRGGVPVGPRATMVGLSDEVDQVVCLLEPRPFHAIGLHNLDVHQLTDDEVCAALGAARPG